MPSPDAVGYVGLTLVDVDAQQLIDNALASASEKFPGWEPREGNTEVVLLEEKAAIAEEIVYAVNEVPNGLAELVLRLFGLSRDQGAPPTALVRFVMTDTAGHTIDQGTTVRLSMGADADPIDFTTDGPLTIPAGQTSGTVRASASEAGELANARAATTLELLDAIMSVEYVELAEPVSGGRAPEDGDAFLDRAAPVLTALTSTLVRPVDVAAYLSQHPELHRVRVLDLYNPANPALPPGNAPGYVTAAVLGEGGAKVPAGDRAVIAAELRNRMHAGLSVAVVDADLTTVNVAVTVLAFAGYDEATVVANVTEAVRAYLDPDSWPWTKTLRVNELIARVDAAEGVDAVLDVTVPATDLILPGHAPVAVAGTVAVTVQAAAQ